MKDHDRIVRLEERVKANRRALKLQATEYERRLDDLNGAHQREREDQADFVSEEKFQAFVDRFDEHKDVTAKALTLAEGTQQGIGRSAGVIVAGFGLLLTIVSVILIVGDVLTP